MSFVPGSILALLDLPFFLLKRTLRGTRARRGGAFHTGATGPPLGKQHARTPMRQWAARWRDWRPYAAQSALRAPVRALDLYNRCSTARGGTRRPVVENSTMRVGPPRGARPEDLNGGLWLKGRARCGPLGASERRGARAQLHTLFYSQGVSRHSERPSAAKNTHMGILRARAPHQTPP